MEIKHKKNDLDAKALQHTAAIALGLVFIFVGLPLWWKTTEVYRVQLPYSEISALPNTKIQQKIFFTIIVFEDAWTENSLMSFGEHMKETFETNESKESKVIMKYQGNIRRAYAGEKQNMNDAKTIEELDDLLRKDQEKEFHGRYQIAILPASTSLLPSGKVVGNSRIGFMQAKQDPDLMDSDLRHFIRDILVDEKALIRTVESATGARHMKADKDSMRALQYHPGLDITFTLLNPQPDILNVQWDIQKAIEEYLSNILARFAQYTELNVKSQYLHYTDLYIKPKVVNNVSTLHADYLPHIITPIEGHLSSHVTTNPNLNFVLYIPTRKQSPLYIVETNGEKTENNAFLSPRWGGIKVLNLPDPPEGVSLPFPIQVDMAGPMATFVSQLRLLLGINTRQKDHVSFISIGEVGIAEWEIDMWMRIHAVENLATASLTLSSLIQLLEEVANIVINDNIGKEVDRAMESIQRTHSFLQSGKLKEAFLSSRQAIISSEKAFFDQSLLELLYFPEDQKFAIYIPLFLPVSIPVVMSLLKAVKWLKEKRKLAKEHTD